MFPSNLPQIYSSFLENPKADVWLSDASLHYVTSMTSVSTSDEIEKHLKKEGILYKKKEQKVLSTVASGNTLVVEVATTIEFIDGGGAILPGMDDNFLADQVVTTPMIHFVTFNGEKIKQVRIYWDQGTLLKQIGVVGRSGANWPIRDGKDQVELIKSSNEAGPMSAGSSRGSSPSRSTTSSKHANRISLFTPREEILEEEHKTIAPKGSLKPHSRDLTAIIAEDDEEQAMAARSPAKGGAVHGPKRTFFVGKTVEEEHSTPDRLYKSHPKKYQHFDFVDPENDKTPAPTPVPPKRTSVYGTKGPSWDFQDFTTPLKKPVKSNPQNERNFGWSDEEEEPEAPPRPAAPPKPRKDADHQFEFTDESPEKHSISAVDQPLPNRTSKMREKTLSHFDIVDESPADKPKSNGNNIPQSRKNVVRDMEANWSNTSPDQNDAENRPIKSKGITIQGDGMGGRKGAGHWDYEDEGTPTASNNNRIKTAGDGMGSRKVTNNPGDTASSGGIKTAGDGMGGRKGAGNHWDFGDESPIQTQYSKHTANKAKQSTQPTGGGFWDF